jgi:hypothetical protein
MYAISGTENVLTDQGGASQPGGTSGTALPTLRSVKTADRIVKGHTLYTVNVREMTIGIRVRIKESLIYMVDTVLREYKEMSDFLCQNAANSVDLSCFLWLLFGAGIVDG